MMFKPLSDAMGLVLALSFAGTHEAAPPTDAHVAASTRWGALAVARDAQPDSPDTLTLDGRPVEGIAGHGLWIVTVEPVAPDADRAVIASAEAESGPPTLFRALIITPQGARVERGTLALRLRGTATIP